MYSILKQDIKSTVELMSDLCRPWLGAALFSVFPLSLGHLGYQVQAYGDSKTGWYDTITNYSLKLYLNYSTSWHDSFALVG